MSKHAEFFASLPESQQGAILEVARIALQDENIVFEMEVTGHDRYHIVEKLDRYKHGEPDAKVLATSMPTEGLKEGTERVPDNFIKEYLPEVNGTTLFGIPMEALDRESLLAFIIYMGRKEKSDRKHFLSSLDMLTGVAQVKNKLSGS